MLVFGKNFLERCIYSKLEGKMAIFEKILQIFKRQTGNFGFNFLPGGGKRGEFSALRARGGKFY
jgi:hypothetical protein